LVEKLRDQRAKRKLDTPVIRLLTQVESALGLLNLRDLCDVDRSGISESLTLVHDGIVLGGDDFAASIGLCAGGERKKEPVLGCCN
jgi:2-keto-3-deoxy-L-rhamnonate aldolase RhmA